MAWVYRDGAEPDPRFSLANERTFLAWVRTALALLAGGVGLEALHIPAQTGLRLAAGGRPSGRSSRWVCSWRRTCLAIGVGGMLFIRFAVEELGVVAVVLGLAGLLLADEVHHPPTGCDRVAEGVVATLWHHSLGLG